MKSSDENTDRLGLDSNILIYAFDKSEGEKHKVCRELIADGFGGKKSFVVPLQALAEFFSTAAYGRVQVSKEEAKEVIEIIITLPNFDVVRYDERTLFDAMDLNQSDGVHFWDCMIATVLVENGVSKIYTENTKDFSGVKAVNPFR
ncbi:PIN domain-containing protein [Candidatus Woesearchaeota archaeon]|nr:PIN domain-containing protein [Candidatus Woesearchaeota archaeon]